MKDIYKEIDRLYKISTGLQKTKFTKNLKYEQSKMLAEKQDNVYKKYDLYRKLADAIGKNEAKSCD